MKKIRIVLTTLVLALAVTGVVVAKTNEKKRTNFSQVYFLNSDNTTWSYITGSTSFFDNTSGGTQAALIENGTGASVPLYSQQSQSFPVVFVKP